MSNDPTLVMLMSLADKVATLSSDVAVLSDRRQDNLVQDAATAALSLKIEALEKDLIQREARAKVLAALMAGGSAIGGATIVKLLTLAGGG